MDPNAIIESYVLDVVRRLPRRQRNDVGFELRQLLAESLDGRAADAGRLADDAMAVDLVAAFGRPQDVADRYRPAGFTVIRPADAPQFAWLALTGVALQWAVTLPVVLAGTATGSGLADSGGGWLGRLSVWWLTWGLGAFWWPGILITFTLIAAAFGHRRGDARPWTPPRIVDRDRVSRPATVLALAFWLVGASCLIALPWLASWAPGLPRPLLDAFAFDPEFLRWRAPWVLLMWAASFGLYVAVLLAGRWTRDTRRLNLAFNMGWLVLLGWWLAAGRIFEAEAAEGVTKLSLVAIVLIVLLDSVVLLQRHAARLRPPVVGSAAATQKPRRG